ncbi:hypothetical protein LTR06_001683 [Exophiala xenobiotica]|nr:hypothetical protein LTR06_001683 [Exophiala xenobiotica]
MDLLFPYPKNGTSFLEVLHHSLTRKLLGFDAVHAEKTPFISGVTSRLRFLLNDAMNHLSFMKIGYTALEAFLQANVTGPPLDFDSEGVVFPASYRDENLKGLKEELFQYLAVDGSRPYPLTPYIELFWLAKVILSDPTLAEAGFNGRRARFRLAFWHQKLLPEESPTLRDEMYADAEILEHQLASRLASDAASAQEHFVEFLIERAVVRTYYGDDALARADLARAATIRNFQFALTGALGKRTKFQDKGTSQLVVLAKSIDTEDAEHSNAKVIQNAEEQESPRPDDPQYDSPSIHATTTTSASPSTTAPHRPANKPSDNGETNPSSTKPANVPLNDDTLLEEISFHPTSTTTMTHAVPDTSSLPSSLSSLDPSNQPLLSPIDSIILLATASSISNTSPSDGLVREETLPYATRVLDGGSSNWQVYTQALLVRSRIEGYRARTAERGLLQLQALVDQVIAETSTSPSASAPQHANGEKSAAPEQQQQQQQPGKKKITTFLPKPQPSPTTTTTQSESSEADTTAASVAERLKYIYQLSPPLRWELEAELAARWTHMGGLKTALEIYERLQMHAEVALCLAATDRESEAIRLLRGLLFHDNKDTGGTSMPDESAATALKLDSLRSPAPADAPRLLCILGDVTTHPEYYSLAWTVSGNRYVRAQRSLARYHAKRRDFEKARDAYGLALNISRIDRTSWFSMGCVQLELEDWMGAVESFTRCVQLDDGDAESWSNLAVALLRLPKPKPVQSVQPVHVNVQEESVVGAMLGSTTTDGRADWPADGDGDGDVDETEQNSSSSSSRERGDPYKHVREALRALRRAATLKRDDARIWDNYLTVAARIPPSAGTPWGEVIQAMGRVVELRGKKEGERAVDTAILRVLTEYVTQTFVYPYPATSSEVDVDDCVEGGDEDEDEDEDEDPAKSRTATTTTTNSTTTTGKRQLPHLPRSFLTLVDTSIAPLATASPTLYALLSDISLWRARPAAALTYAEKSWRSFLVGASMAEEFDTIPQDQWVGVVDKTLWLMRTYRSLGPMQRERTGGEVEAKWRFKARSAGRRVAGRGKRWEAEGNEAWRRLKAEIEGVST